MHHWGPEDDALVGYASARAAPASRVPFYETIRHGAALPLVSPGRGRGTRRLYLLRPSRTNALRHPQHASLAPCSDSRSHPTALAFYTERCTVTVMTYTESEFSVTEASSRGIAGLVADAERGETVIVTRRSRRVAAVVGMDRLDEIGELRDDLRDLALVLARQATDTGRRTSMDEVLAAFGHTRESLAEFPD